MTGVKKNKIPVGRTQVSETRTEYTVAQLEVAGYTKADLRLLTKQRRKPKWGNQKTPCSNHHVHASGAEARRCTSLHLMQSAHIIYALVVQPRFMLAPAFERDGKRYRASYYVGDFFYIEPEGTKSVCEDVKAKDRKTGKSLTTPLFRYKWKEAIRLHSEIEFRMIEA